MAEQVTKSFFAAAHPSTFPSSSPADSPTIGPATHAELQSALRTHVLPSLMRHLTAAVAGEVAQEARTSGVKDAAATYIMRASTADNSLAALPPVYFTSVERQLEARISQLRKSLASEFHYRHTRVEKVALVVYLTKTLKDLRARRELIDTESEGAAVGVSRAATSATAHTADAPVVPLSSKINSEPVDVKPPLVPAFAESELEKINRLALLEQIEADLQKLRTVLTSWPPPQDRLEEASQAVILMRMKMKLQTSSL